MNVGKLIKNGIWDENPTFVQAIGLCPTLAVSTSAINGIGMGVAATAVLIGSNVVISLMRKFIPDDIRIPAFIVVIAGFVTLTQFIVAAYAPDLDKALGIFIPLIVVNCIILARAEAFAFKNGVVSSLFDGLGMGIGFGIALGVLGSVRELLGAGTLFDVRVMPAGFQPGLIMILAPGGFMTLGIAMGLFNLYKAKSREKKRARGIPVPDEKSQECGACAGCPAGVACGFGVKPK